MTDGHEPRRASRRDFLRAGLAVLGIPVATAVAAVPGSTTPAALQDSLAGRGAIGTLRDPSAVGRPLRPTDPEENAAEIQAIELRLACNCGCTLDVFTCRTTDFSCTYSPKLHREVLALRDQGMSARQVIDAFVERYGEKALMAPKPKGFNLAGYLVPGAAIATAGAALVLLISRRRAGLAAQAPAGASATPIAASPDELARLQRALDEVED